MMPTPSNNPKLRCITHDKISFEDARMFATNKQTIFEKK